MSTIRTLYGGSLALLTDLYQLTMACAHWRAGTAEREAVYHLTARRAPDGDDAMVFCGLDAVIDYVDGFAFADDDIAWLATLHTGAGTRLLPDDFLAWLRDMQLTVDIDAPREGTVLAPQTPLLRVRGPVAQAQMLESALLNLVGFPTLIATKAARLAQAAGGAPVLDFGLRKAHGIDGGVTAARAAYVGGCAATANVLAGKLFGIPVRGTHAHGWIMAFDDELESFHAYARALPDNCIFLVDTYDTLSGIRNAIAAGRALREAGHEMVGIRLDSGDLGRLAVEARRMLDEAGFGDAVVVASSGMDEHAIARLCAGGAPIAVWGVGTSLSTGQPDAALDVVYKLSAIRGEDGAWRNRMKLSDSPDKMSCPGILQVRRYLRDGAQALDLLYDEGTVGADFQTARDPVTGADITLPAADRTEELLCPAVRGGRRHAPPESIDSARRRALHQFAQHARPLTLAMEERLWNERERLRSVQAT